MYGALRAPTSNCVVLLVQGTMETAETVVWYHDDSDGGGRRSTEEQDNWYSRSLM
jgi:hypothetical protein